MIEETQFLIKCKHEVFVENTTSLADDPGWQARESYFLIYAETYDLAVRALCTNHHYVTDIENCTILSNGDTAE